MTRTTTRLASVLALTLLATSAAFAQDSDDPAALKPAEPDYTLIDLPTSLALPPFGTAIRITHRFVLPLKCDAASNLSPTAVHCANSLLGDAFRIDGGANIGLEFRIGVVRNGQLVVHRASSGGSDHPEARKVVEFLGEYTLTHQTGSMPLEIAALAAVEGTKNFTDVYSPAFGLAVTSRLGEKAAIHVDPLWVHKSDLLNDDTLMIGVGARILLARGVYVTGEITPRVNGYKPGKNLASFAIEKRMGGHVFQLNFSNANQGTTFRQIAAGAIDNKHWYMGFNLTRKFF